MRGVLLFGLCLVAAGCGSKAKSTVPSLQVSSVPRDNRIDAFQVWQEAYGQKAVPDKYPLDGKTVLVKFSDVEATTDGDGKPVLVYGAEKGKYKPAIVARLSDTAGYTAGESLTNVYVEGHLKGCVPISTESWAKPWLSLPQQKGLPHMHIVLVDDAKIALPPKD
jgi:hypothetical protein